MILLYSRFIVDLNDSDSCTSMRRIWWSHAGQFLEVAGSYDADVSMFLLCRRFFPISAEEGYYHCLLVVSTDESSAFTCMSITSVFETFCILIKWIYWISLNSLLISFLISDNIIIFVSAKSLVVSSSVEPSGVGTGGWCRATTHKLRCNLPCWAQSTPAPHTIHSPSSVRWTQLLWSNFVTDFVLQVTNYN